MQAPFYRLRYKTSKSCCSYGTHILVRTVKNKDKQVKFIRCEMVIRAKRKK